MKILIARILHRDSHSINDKIYLIQTKLVKGIINISREKNLIWTGKRSGSYKSFQNRGFKLSWYLNLDSVVICTLVQKVPASVQINCFLEILMQRIAFSKIVFHFGRSWIVDKQLIDIYSLSSFHLTFWSG